MEKDDSEGSCEDVVELSDSNDDSPKQSSVSTPTPTKRDFRSWSSTSNLKPSSSNIYAVASANNNTAGPWDTTEDIPAATLNKLLEQLTRQSKVIESFAVRASFVFNVQWLVYFDVPVLPKQELEILMEISISLIRQGIDGESKNFQQFLNGALVLAFEKLMQDEAMRDWKLDIHRYIWLSIERYFEMFIEKLHQTLDAAQIPNSFWTILNLTMSRESRYHMQNASYDIQSLSVDYDVTDMGEFVRNEDNGFGWLRLLLFRFGVMEGFKLVKLFFEKNVDEKVPDTAIIEWLSPFASCASLLKPEIVAETFHHVLEVSLRRLRLIDIKSLKCETVKGDLRDSLYMALPRLLHMFFVVNPVTATEAKELAFFELKYPPKEAGITLKDLALWLREQSFLEILFRDNLHHLSFCERIERILRVLLQNDAIMPQELDIIWNAQRGKHDAIQRNLHDLIAKLINLFSNELQEKLFALMKESWSESSPRERTLLLDLIRRIGNDYSLISEKNLTLKSLSLLWDLFRDERLPVEVGDAALEAHFTVIESLGRSDALFKQYIDKCIEELLNDSVFVLPTLNHMQKIFRLVPEGSFTMQSKTSRSSFIAAIQLETDLCAALTNNVSLYMKKVQETLQKPSSKLADAEAGTLKIDGRYTHEENLRIRLGFLHFLLTDGHLLLKTPQANELWDALVVNAVTSFERTYGFQLFYRMQSKKDIEPAAVEEFFNTRILQFPVEQLDSDGFLCFKIFWITVNKAASKLLPPDTATQCCLASMELEGSDYLWEVILKSPEPVSRSAITLWVEIFSSPDGEKIDIGRLNEDDFVIVAHISTYFSFTMLRENRSELTSETSNEDSIQNAIRQMSRILSVSHELEKARRQWDQRDSCNFEFSTSASLASPQNEEYMIPVHSHMTLAVVRHRIEERLKGIEGIADCEAQFKLYVQRLNAGGGEQTALGSQSKRKTLEELMIDSTTQLVVSSFIHRVYCDSIFHSSDSSLDGSDEFRSEEVAEFTLPGWIIASNFKYVRFLCDLADIGYLHKCFNLRDSAQKVLNQIPTDATSIDRLETMIKNDNLSHLFPSEKPSESLHLLAVLHSLLMPAATYALQEATSFQKTFFSSSSCLAVIEFLDNPEIFYIWDTAACCTALWWIMNITKFILSYPRKNVHDRDMVLYIKNSLGPEQEVFKEYCDLIAKDLDRNMTSGEISLNHLESFHFAKNSRLVSLLMNAAWVCGSKELPLKADVLDEESNIYSFSLSEPETINALQQQLTVCALDTLSCASANEGAIGLILENESSWNNMIIDLLFSCSSVIKQHVVEVVKRIVCRERPAAVQGSDVAVKSLAEATVELLFKKFSYVDQKPEAASEYFSLLCRLLEYCRNHSFFLDPVMKYIEEVLEWLEQAKQHTVVHMEHYPNDCLLIGHFELCRSLISFLTPEAKMSLGSDENGRKLVKNQCEIKTLGTQLEIRCDHEASMPRSVTIDPIPTSRCVPVCGSDESVGAAYDLLISLCEEAPRNYYAAISILMEMFYSGNSALIRFRIFFDRIFIYLPEFQFLAPLSMSNIDWEYLPGFPARLPNNYVGLKNGGATCYMNSVFQQIFMIEKLRNSILNAKCSIDVDVDDSQFDDRSSILHSVLQLVHAAAVFLFKEGADLLQKDYHQVLLKSVQTIFAHLLGSELQFYTPKFFWNHFRFGGQPVNVREQQDALEFYNAIFDTIDEGMKAIGEPPICELLFGGTFADQKICKDCPHRYQREETFTSISLDIRSHNNLIASLKEYVKGDLLNNDNAYFCEQCGQKVTAVKRLCLAKLPPYLTIQLKRFDFDWERDLPQKYNDYFEFPLELDMKPFTAQGLAEAEAEAFKESQMRSPVSTVDSGNGASVTTTPEMFVSENVALLSESKNLDESSTFYRLRGVVVHSGQANGGHYYSFIRSEEDEGQWYKFDDVDVSKWQVSREEMRNMWFGGDYVADSYDGNGKSFQKRRQKRWWNAYLLIYEKVASKNSLGISSEESNVFGSLPHSSSSSAHESANHVTIDTLEKSLQSVSFGIHVSDEHYRYTPQYFQFVRELTSCAIKMINYTTASRKGGNMTEWQKNLEYLLSASTECRAWFICNVLFQPKLIVSYLLSATALDVSKVRFFFANTLCALLNLTRNDHVDSLKPFLGCCPEFNIEKVYSQGDTVSDILLSILLIVPRNYFPEFTSHPAQYFAMFHQYANLGFEQKKQMVRKGILNSMLVLISQDIYRMKAVYHETAKLYDVLSLLLRTCDFGSPHWNPYSISKSGLEPAPPEVKKLIQDSSFLDRFLKQILEMPSDHEIVLSTLLFLCWENLPLSKLAFKHLSFQARFCKICSFQSMFTPNEVKQGTEVIESLTSIDDSVKRERLRFVLFGSTGDLKFKGYIATLFWQRDTYVWKTCIMLQALLRIIANNPETNQMLMDEKSVHEMLRQMEGWLDKQSPRPSSFTYGCRPSEKTCDLKRSGSATDLLKEIKELNASIAGAEESERVEEEIEAQSDEDQKRLQPYVDSLNVYNPHPGSDEEDHGPNENLYFPEQDLKSSQVKIKLPQTDWDEDNLSLVGTVSYEDNQATIKSLPPPPLYSESNSLNKHNLFKNFPVCPSAAGDQAGGLTRSGEDTDKPSSESIFSADKDLEDTKQVFDIKIYLRSKA
ncbi:unnamed protein product [Enterobius vermicularis]|uniref:USP domain-containing protein n=1 Tax=Enterobius vermicularis TaxID=51028 RepID=A0A158QAS4_ENTVE|nr:unnamed protein product [Enterobius vermicularis]